jgi:putative FmdB family regulatory protein
MPIYEYVCTYCGEIFELLRRLSDEDINIKCPKCGKTKVKRMISTFSTVSSTNGCVPSASTGST